MASLARSPENETNAFNWVSGKGRRFKEIRITRLGGTGRSHDFHVRCRVGSANITSKRVERRIPARRSAPVAGLIGALGAPRVSCGGSARSRARTHLDRQAGLNLGGQRHAGRVLLLLVFLLREHRGPGPVRGKAQSANVLHVPNLHHVLVHRWATLHLARDDPVRDQATVTDTDATYPSSDESLRLGTQRFVCG